MNLSDSDLPIFCCVSAQMGVIHVKYNHYYADSCNRAEEIERERNPRAIRCAKSSVNAQNLICLCRNRLPLFNCYPKASLLEHLNKVRDYIQTLEL